MAVKGKSLRKLSRVLVAAKGAERVRFVKKVESEEELIFVGFNGQPNEGDSVIPRAVGKVSEFNVNGKEVIRKDLPKEPEPISFHTTWLDWHGYEHSGIQTRLVDKYPRDYINAPASYLSIANINGEQYVCTDAFLLTEDSDEVLHLANLMLELFEEFEVYDEESQAIQNLEIKRLNWEILPKGDYPWDKTKEIISPILKNLKDSQKPVVEERLRKITKKSPDFIAVGNAGFNGYFVFGFSDNEQYVFESVHLGNATYVFGDNWEELSLLTKNEIINGELDHERIIHDDNWDRQLNRILSN
ncbi:hypothetical protein [Vibrio sinaloensis]|uniref:hypothetical protein n=1 Tax=Photobacterium sp. (strain ATCC 43367) TaxID=379097 RepID=UPI00057F4DCA|nr:hypothetical protein [Vibrio sinaloensis]KHT38041.1 hypothetical protein RJ46_18740 [Vibrio sinaloensis]